MPFRLWLEGARAAVVPMGFNPTGGISNLFKLDPKTGKGKGSRGFDCPDFGI